MAWAEAIEQVMRDTGTEEVTLWQIYRSMVKLPLVTNHHKESWSDGVPNYKHWTRKYLSTLCREGKVRRVGRGIYSLTDR
jgi:hypothetical protein